MPLSRLEMNRCSRRSAFSLAELLVVVGILALLIALLLPPMQLARRQVLATHCSAKLQTLGRALVQSSIENRGFFPYWDDAGAPVRFTWIDVLTQTRMLGETDPGSERAARAAGTAIATQSAGYCPADPLPEPQNAARHPSLVYPLTRQGPGIDYSYGIGATLAAGGWANLVTVDGATRAFRDHERDAANRVLAGDAYTSVIWNLSGSMLRGGRWNSPTQFDNTAAWTRHAELSAPAATANFVFQDGHVGRVIYDDRLEQPVDTLRAFVWRRDESAWVNPTDDIDGEYYPSVLPPNAMSNPPGAVYPDRLLPGWYSRIDAWTLIHHK